MKKALKILMYLIQAAVGIAVLRYCLYALGFAMNNG